MVKLNSIVSFLNGELKIKSVKDDSVNGLQFKASTEVKKIGLTTDACIDTFKKAKALGCDLLVVHHGIMWKNEKYKSGIALGRTSFLKKNKISLYVVHLPLDKSKRHGHNAYLMRMLGAEPKEKFDGVGYIGYLKSPKNVGNIVKTLEGSLGTKCKVWKFGKEKIRKIAVVSGAGASDLPEAMSKKVDLFVTGEPVSWMYYYAKEGKINVVFPGHYKTETSGVKAIGKLVEKKFGLKTVFIDYNPSGM